MKLSLFPSLKITVPLLLLAFAALLSSVNFLYHIPRAEQAAANNAREHLFQEISRMQASLEYLLLKGDLEGARREVAVLASSPEYSIVALLDEGRSVIAATRRAWFGRPIKDVMPEFDGSEADQAARQRRARIVTGPGSLIGYSGVLLGSAGQELSPSQLGQLFIVYDLSLSKAQAQAQILNQSLYWTGLIVALALLLWFLFHFVLTRRAEHLVSAAERLAAGDLQTRSGLTGRDELARLSHAFDVMTAKVADTQTALQRDIVERERTEEALRASEEQYREMFNASIDGLALWNVSGEIVDINPALWEMHGYTREEFLNMPSEAVVHPDYQPKFEEFLRSVAAGKPFHAEAIDVRKDGSALALEIHGVPMHYLGKPHVLTIARDLTEKKRAAAELAQQRETLYQREKIAAMGSLLAGVAHELNNPLSVVVARAVMLEESEHVPTRTAAQKIRAAAERCARIVRTFLAMARQHKPERTSVQINEVVTDAMEILSYGLRAGGIELKLDLAPNLPRISADADQLHQVLMNLIANAQQALQDQLGPRRLCLRTRYEPNGPNGNVVRVVVEDNGPGIPKAIRSRIFEPYFTTKPLGAGTGVGLSVCLGIIEAHGGTLSIDCPSAGGTVFTVVLPVGSEEMTETDTAPVAVAMAQRTVLIVDDEAEIRETLVEILEGDGHRVVTVASGREALEQMNAEHYDVIVTDIRMPDLDGHAFYRAIEERWPSLGARVVFITGDTLTPASIEFAAQIGRPVIEKPFLPADVRRLVAEVAEGIHSDTRV